MRNENPNQTIQRELFEESGLHLQNLQLKAVFRSPEMRRLEVIFTGELINWGDFSPSIEVSEAHFYPIDQLPNILSGHKEIIKRYHTR